MATENGQQKQNYLKVLLILVSLLIGIASFISTKVITLAEDFSAMDVQINELRLDYQYHENRIKYIEDTRFRQSDIVRIEKQIEELDKKMNRLLNR